MTRTFQTTAAALATALLLAACGGGDSADTTPKLKIGAVKVFGDSLADSGTFGYKFTVQSSDNLIFPERVAASYGATLCNYYSATGANSFVPNSKAGCTNYAIGGGRLNYYSNPADPRGVTVQLAQAATTGFAATDMALIDGGGNDAADLVGAFLKASSDGGASFVALVGTLGVKVTAPGAAGLAAAGTAYMQALADKLAKSVSDNVLGKGGQQVVILNMPGVTNTPKFQMVLASLEASLGAAKRAEYEALFKSWIVAFNTQLDGKFSGEARVAVVDFYTAFNDQIATPAQFGLTNVKTPACPITGQGSDGLPTYDFPTCTATALSAKPPAGVSDPDWWKSYGFADSFHPTPYGHQLTGQLISKTLAIKGWL
ncbi:SGNH/GDSL hydrolase family protein [Roseateles violae]|uniref:SGNH/GDSL hydrolase family protein n=1 Tax=Roseateles violae TaxID=3058042 RepID=A0ABT8DQI6_9BURK|nr:SGNH/GDSL hydrolase family protein [Pelomonas sp. PFR6]MDN3919204.1 SGNH/GDSL hydrolase family protein [Pelomonas sp. PFR6]